MSYTAAQLAQNSLNIAQDWQGRITNGADLNDISPAQKSFMNDICSAISQLAQATLGASPTSVTQDPADSVNVPTTSADAETPL